MGQTHSKKETAATSATQTPWRRDAKEKEGDHISAGSMTPKCVQKVQVPAKGPQDATTFRQGVKNRGMFNKVEE